MRFVILLFVLSMIGCSNSTNSPQSRHFDLRPDLISQNRYECSKDGADQACIVRGFTSSSSRDGCTTVGDTTYLSGMTCVNE